MTGIRYDLLGIIGYGAEVSEPGKMPVWGYYTDRHLSPVLDQLVAYIEQREMQVRADERSRCDCTATTNALDIERAATLADLRAKVEGLVYDDPAIDAVLALIKEAQDG